LKLATPKRSDIRVRKFEPFAIGALLCEPAMPVRLDASGIVGTDRMNEACDLRERDTDFLHAAL
jgi:hypothetical protein